MAKKSTKSRAIMETAERISGVTAEPLGRAIDSSNDPLAATGQLVDDRSGEDAEDAPATGLRRMLSGQELAGMLRQQRREERLKERGY